MHRQLQQSLRALVFFLERWGAHKEFWLGNCGSLIAEWINLVLQHLFWYGNFLHNLWFQICGQDMAWCLLLFRWGSLFQLIGFPDHGKLYQWSAPASGGRPRSRRTSAPCWHSTWRFVGGCRWSAWQPEGVLGGVPPNIHGVFPTQMIILECEMGVLPFEETP